MYHILQKLHASTAVKSLDIFELIEEPELQTLHCRAVLRDGSFLFIRETVNPQETKYSYHWQDKRGRLLVRWDNAPHHLGLATFPHHKHIGSPMKVAPSKETTFDDIFQAIIKRLEI